MSTDSKKEPSAMVVPFGKYKGASVAELLSRDPDYADWIAAQGWVAERFAELHAAIVSRGAGTDDSPEHNALQAKFLDPVFRVAFLLCATSDRVAGARSEVVEVTAEGRQAAVAGWATQLDDAKRWHSSEEVIQELTAKLASAKEAAETVVAVQLETAVSFEQKGVDVVVAATFAPRSSASEISHRMAWRQRGLKCAVELKPTVGDDYPTVMRQMSRIDARYLVLENYTGRAVSLADVRRMFEANELRLVLLREIEAEIANARAFIASHGDSGNV